MTKITGFDTFDVRFPTSRTLAGSDAMNPAPDYSAAYVVIRTDAADPALSGHGFAFTIGRGNDVQLAAIRLLEPFLAGQDLDEVLADLGSRSVRCWRTTSAGAPSPGQRWARTSASPSTRTRSGTCRPPSPGSPSSRRSGPSGSRS